MHSTAVVRYIGVCTLESIMIARHSRMARSLPQTPRFSYTVVLYLMQEVSQFSSHWSTLRLHSLLNARETSDATCVHGGSGNAEISIALPQK